MSLPVKSATQLVNDQTAAMQSAAGQTLDFAIGSILRAVVESNMGNSLWLQAMVTALLAVTRLSSSSGTDVDTFIGDFGLSRIPAVAATGSVIFSRFTATNSATIPVVTLVSSVANGVSYAVIVDTNNPYYHADLNAYVIPALTSSISVPVQATTAGANTNVLSNQITTINSVLVNVDSVTNPDPFTNGKDQESDDSVKRRFVLYLASLFRATKQALEFAVELVPEVKKYIIIENKDINDVTYYGYFFIIIDDGTGNASSGLISRVSASVENYRGLTIAYSVFPPVQFPISIVAHVHTDGTVADSVVHDQVVAAYQAFISAQDFRALFAYSRVPAIAYGANSTITDVTNYTLNGGTSDIQLVGQEIMTIGTITIIMNA